MEGHRIPGASGESGDIANSTGRKKRKEGGNTCLQSPVVRVSVSYPIYASLAIDIMD